MWLIIKLVTINDTCLCASILQLVTQTCSSSVAKLSTRSIVTVYMKKRLPIGIFTARANSIAYKCVLLFSVIKYIVLICLLPRYFPNLNFLLLLPHLIPVHAENSLPLHWVKLQIRKQDKRGFHFAAAPFTYK